MRIGRDDPLTVRQAVSAAAAMVFALSAGAWAMLESHAVGHHPNQIDAREFARFEADLARRLDQVTEEIAKVRSAITPAAARVRASPNTVMP